MSWCFWPPDNGALYQAPRDGRNLGMFREWVRQQIGGFPFIPNSAIPAERAASGVNYLYGGDQQRPAMLCETYWIDDTAYGSPCP
jgi:hypothetical protein